MDISTVATGEIRLSILTEWIHKGAKLTEEDEETGCRKGDLVTMDLFERLLEEEYEKLRIFPVIRSFMHLTF